MVFQRRERTVGHQKTTPKNRIQSKGMAEDAPERPAVGRDQNGSPLPRRHIENTARPLLQRSKILAAGGVPDSASAQPSLPVFRKAFADLLIGQTRPAAVIAFPELRHRQNRDGLRLSGSDDSGGFKRPAEVAGVDPIQRHGFQTDRQGFRLFSSPFMERNIGLALNALVPVPRRFTVSHKINNRNGSSPFQGGFLPVRPAPRLQNGHRK